MKTKTFPAETEPVVEGLRELFRRAGYGAMTRVARSLGLRKTFYSEKRHRERFDVGVLIATLRELGTQPAAFFATLDGETDPCLWAPMAERSTHATRRAVRLAYRRMREELPGVDLVRELEAEVVKEDFTVTNEAPALGVEWIADLDNRLLAEPEIVATEITTGIERAEAHLLPAALGLWSSALRLMLELDVGAFLNRWAVRLAQAADDSATVADLYLRRSYIVADAGDHERALMLTERAAGIFARLDRETDEGRALVDCGRWLHYLDRHQESISSFERALGLLPESQSKNRFAAFQSLGCVHLQLGELDSAQAYVKRAMPLAISDHWRVKLLWLEARILRKGGRLGESGQIFQQIVEKLRGIHFGEMALAACELVQATLEHRRPAKARQVCLSLLPMLEPLRENAIVDAAMSELLRTGVHGSLSLDLVRRTRLTIEAEAKNSRARQQWRALAARSYPCGS